MKKCFETFTRVELSGIADLHVRCIHCIFARHFTFEELLFVVLFWITKDACLI